MVLAFVSIQPVCVFWLGHLIHLHFKIISYMYAQCHFVGSFWTVFVGDPPLLAGKSGPVSSGVTFLPLDPRVHETVDVPETIGVPETVGVHETVGVPETRCASSSGVSVPSGPMNVMGSNPSAFKARFSGAPATARTPGWGICYGTQNFHSCRRTFVV